MIASDFGEGTMLLQASWTDASSAELAAILQARENAIHAGDFAECERLAGRIMGVVVGLLEPPAVTAAPFVVPAAAGDSRIPAP
jgi:hypothetical protein